MFTSFFHPLTTFPVLLDYGLLAPFLLRLTVGLFRLGAGSDRYKKEYKWMSIFYVLSSLMLILGWYTQIASFAALILVGFDYFTAKAKAPLTREQVALTVVLSVMLLTLIITGPGAFAMDLPL